MATAAMCCMSCHSIGSVLIPQQMPAAALAASTRRHSCPPAGARPARMPRQCSSGTVPALAWMDLGLGVVSSQVEAMVQELLVHVLLRWDGRRRASQPRPLAAGTATLAVHCQLARSDQRPSSLQAASTT